MSYGKDTAGGTERNSCKGLCFRAAFQQRAQVLKTHLAPFCLPVDFLLTNVQLFGIYCAFIIGHGL